MTRNHVRAILDALSALYPLDYGSLEYEKPYELLFAVRLAAQCTDARVNQITPVLYGRYPSLEAIAGADFDELAEIVHSCGFYRAKARDIIASAQMLLSVYGGHVPDEMDELLKLPGVGRKTANLILGDVYGKPAIVADTHCIRISGLLGLTDGTKDPYKVEMQLVKVIPPAEQSSFCHRLVFHGRAVCVARRPDCTNCALAPYCKYALDKNFFDKNSS